MVSWQPGCSIEHIQLRAKLLRDIREYFYAQNVLEVETPALCQTIGTDPYLDFFSTYLAPGENNKLYLQTSPEFAMKRLLAGGTGSIYQISKAFRKGESGRLHNPEFSMLEWYRVGFNLEQLMDDVELLLSRFLPAEQFPGKTERIKYADIFKRYTGLNALQFDRSEYQSVAESLGFPEADDICTDEHVTWLDFLFSHSVQQHLGENGLCMVYDYPACLPSLARLQTADQRVAERVELFLLGIELGNGYHELSDMVEQRTRFQREVLLREANGAEKVSIDERLLASLQHGLPDCSGIALGLDRLLMILSQKNHIDEVLAFPIKNA